MKPTTQADGFKPVKTNQNAHLFPPTRQGDFEMSVTVPDQAMSIREILDRHSRGLPLDGVRVPVWDGEEEVPDFRRMDLAEIEQMMRENREEITYLQQETKALEEIAAKRTETALPASQPPPEG